MNRWPAPASPRRWAGWLYLNALAHTPSAANIRRYAEIVRERAMLRKLVSIADEISAAALNPQGKEARQLLDEAESKGVQDRPGKANAARRVSRKSSRC